MKKVFVVYGTHGNETNFGKPVAELLAGALGEKHGAKTVELVSIPDLGGRFKGYADEPSMRAYDYLVDRGFDPSNPKHFVIDVHENPVNWMGRYTEYADFYSEHVAKAIEESQREGTHGLYFAAIGGKRNYADFRSILRQKISAMRKSDARFLRVEVPVVSDNDRVTADHEKTVGLIPNAKNPEDFAKRISRVIASNLPRSL